MTQEEYKKNTDHAVKLIKAMNEVIGTHYCPEFSQEYGDTASLVQALEILITHINKTIQNTKEVGAEYAESQKYIKFASNVEPNRTVKFSEIPSQAIQEIRAKYVELGGGSLLSQDTFAKAVDWFKTRYNICKIEF